MNSRHNILLGISASIAAYKAVELTRLLKQRGHEVRVVMTPSAHALIAPLTLQAVSGHPVRTRLLDAEAEAGMDHIAFARWADIILLAPASADLIARLAAGLADDLLTTLVLASEAPLWLAPAMNHRMWLHPATQDNLSRLQHRGARMIGPAVGDQACGEQGPGRMSEPADIVARVDAVGSRKLEGVRVVITAGPTREAIDPVRFIGNRSSGKLGYALAAALAQRGARVSLISGPTGLPNPGVEELVSTESALEMRAAVMSRMQSCDIFVATAAVADYRPEVPAEQKIKKQAQRMEIALIRNPDILAEVASREVAPFTVGFAAETDNVEPHARAKLEAKGLDLIAANLVGAANGGFERDENALILLWSRGRMELPMMPKTQLAHALATQIIERYDTKAASQNPR